MADLFELSRRMKVLSATLPKTANEEAKQAGLTILGALVWGTPVDKSKALSNWQVSVDTPNTAQRQPYFPGEKGSTYAESAQAAFEVGKTVILSKLPGQKLFITNALPYIRRLNDGYSSQAPAGFVERSVMLGRKFARLVKTSIG